VSLVSRISAFFLAFLALILLGFSVTLYLLARTHFQRDLDERLMVALDGLTVAAEIEPGHIEWRPGLRAPTDDAHPDDAPVGWVVYDGRGSVVERSTAAGAFDLSGALEDFPAVGHYHVTRPGRDGRPWRLAVRRLLPARPSAAIAAPRAPGERTPARGVGGKTVHPSLVIAAGAPLGPVEASLAAVALTLAGLSAAVWLLAAAAGRHLCRRALRPMTLMARAAGAMTADDRAQRLPSPGTGDELEGLARSFNGLLDRLHEALVRQERFTGDASHQLRTPLAALRGQVEVALRRERTAGEYRRTLEQLRCESERLQRIVESLLFLSRSASDAGRPDLEAVDLATWLPAHLGNWSSHPRAADLRAEVEAVGDAPLTALAHSGLLGQLLDNLIENAFKYSEPGSPVDVRLRREPGVVSVAVADRGPGLTADERAHVFEPFYRSPRARRLGAPGVGLGLAVVARIAAAFGGAASAEGEPGRGSTFTVRLPAAGPAPLSPVARVQNAMSLDE
jgi:signal transduction histidine kinase